MNNLQEKEYRLLGNIAPITYQMKTGAKGNLLVFFQKGKTTGYNRAIRHCRNEKSIFLDEQSEYAEVSPVIFEKGYLKVPATDIATQTFLDTHPDNSANKGRLFEVVDDAMEAEEFLELEDLIIDLKSLVKQKQEEEDGLFELQTLASVIKNSYVATSKMSKPELRNIIYRSIDANAYQYVDDNGNYTLFDTKVKRKYLALRSIGEGIIQLTPDGRTFVWAKSSEPITSVPAGVKPTEALAEYLETDDGILVLDKIMKEI